MNVALPAFDHWSNLSIDQIITRLDFEWILAGGYALEAFAGKFWRQHADIDIIIKRTDQAKLHKCFSVDQLFVAEKPGKLSPWNSVHYYEKPIQDIWVLDEKRSSWCLQIMMVDCIDDYWVYKRQPDIRLPYKDLYFEQNGIKVIRPEIQLLYKAGSNRPKDDQDQEVVSPLLTKEASEWLNATLKASKG